MGLSRYLGGGRKISIPEQPQFNVGLYGQAIGERRKLEEQQATEQSRREQSTLRGLMTKIQKAQETESTRKGMLDSGSFYRTMRERQEASRTGEGDIQKTLGQNIQQAVAAEQARKSSSLQWAEEVQQNYNQMVGKLKSAKREQERKVRLNSVIASLALLTLPFNPTALAMIGTGATLGGIALSGRQQGGDGKQSFQGDTTGTQDLGEWRERLDPSSRQYWNEGYWNRFIRPGR